MWQVYIPGAAEAFVVARTVHSQHAHTRADVNTQVRVRIGEIKRSLLTAFYLFTGVVPVVAFRLRASAINEMDALYETVQLVTFVEV